MKRPLDVRCWQPRDCDGSALRPASPPKGLVGGLGLAVASLFLLQAPACSSSSSTPDGGSNPPAQVCLPLDAGLPVVVAWQGVDAGPDGEPLDEFLDDYYAAYCDAESRCVPFASYLIATCLNQLHAAGTWYSYPQCRQSAFGLECESQGYDLTVVAQQVASAGLGEALSYDPHAAAACLAVPWSCVYGGPDILFPLACSAAFVGLVPDGGACDFSSECQEGNCVPASGDSCVGTCGAPARRPLRRRGRAASVALASAVGRTLGSLATAITCNAGVRRPWVRRATTLASTAAPKACSAIRRKPVSCRLPSVRAACTHSTSFPSSARTSPTSAQPGWFAKGRGC